MKPTEEQALVVSTFAGNQEPLMAVIAYAGGGKSSTVKMMANASDERGLYLVFNKRNAEEAKASMPRHVEPRTFHSLAFRSKGIELRDKLNSRITGRQLAQELGIQDFSVLSSAHIARAVQSAVRTYCQSADDYITGYHCYDYSGCDSIWRKRQRQNWSEEDIEVEKEQYEELIYRKAKQLWPRLIDPSDPLPCEHDVYLKLFQLDKPILRGYDWIAVDEAQDTNQVCLDIINRQRDHCKILYIGDPYQAIYGWRGAVNAMEQLDWFAKLYLSQSFRYGQQVADVANRILSSRFDLEVAIKGNPLRDSSVGMVDRSQPYALVARKNQTLLDHAVALLRSGEQFAVVGGTQELGKLLESIYWLSIGDRQAINHPDIMMFQDWEEFEEEAKDDHQLKRLAELITTLGDDTPNVAAQLRRMDRNDPQNSPIVLTTAHKSKGLEFSQVILAEDYCGWDGTDQWDTSKGSDEDWRILYVAATRALDRLQPNALLDYLRGR